MKTIEKYEKSETDELKKLLEYHEKVSKLINLQIKKFNISDKQYQKFKNISCNCEIDINLIRMELNKRLWYS